MSTIKTEFSLSEIEQINNRGITLEDVERQISIFKRGTDKIILDRPATINDGICFFDTKRFEELSYKFENNSKHLKLTKFTPASGAASRMFQFLNDFLNDFDINKETINSYLNRSNNFNLRVFLTGIEKFPFYKEVLAEVEFLYPNFNSMNRDYKNYYFIKTLLSKDHYDYANKPKGVLNFHHYDQHIATPIEEHLVESMLYSNSNYNAHVHFTISEQHQYQFQSIVESIKPKVEQEFASTIHVSFSYQKHSTDTIAVDEFNVPVRDENDALLFRPGGHGALIENLNDLDADIIFIKNIDNVIHNQFEEIAFYKKGLAGLLLKIQEQVFTYLRDLHGDRNIQLDEIVEFIEDQLLIEIPDELSKYTLEHKIQFLDEILNRPIRVCGMVKNEGEPGGGPFWVRDKRGNVSLQIVETAQIDTTIQSQNAILKQSTHFNPVDLVCGIKNFKGEKFDLTQYIDRTTGFIVEKNKNGKKLKSYELPGLWNGAMAKWITLFVEVPLVTFNPVKTVNDLLKPAHQPN